MTQIAKAVPASQPCEGLRGEVVDVEAIKIIQEFAPFVRFILQRIGDFYVQDSTFDEQVTKQFEQVEIEHVLDNMRHDDKVVGPETGRLIEARHSQVLQVQQSSVFQCRRRRRSGLETNERGRGEARGEFQQQARAATPEIQHPARTGEESIVADERTVTG